MMIVGLTGNAASGKSEVGLAWRQVGIPVVDADTLARRAVEPGTEGLRAVREAFGNEVIEGDGTLDRATLRRIIFSDPSARARLEAIIHPEVRRLRDAWVEARAREGETVVVVEIPLLFEADLHDTVHTSVVVCTPEARQRARLEARGLSVEEVRQIRMAQMAPDAQADRADLVIDNDGDLAALRRTAALLLGELLAGAGRPRAEGPTMTLDLHLHTVGSWDSLADPEAILTRAEAQGIDRIAITDHNELDVARAMAERYPERVIPGEEVRTAEGIDVIGLYLSEVIPRGTPARETVRRIREQGGIPYLPHPFAWGKGGRGRHVEELAPLIDVIEVFNARLHPETLNAPAHPIVQRFGRLISAGSDAHTVREIGGVRVVVPRHENEADALRRALARATWTGEEASIVVHLGSTWSKIRKRLPGAPRFETAGRHAAE
ncbi:MAG: dephospho-CoA kinase [Longimicrobiales bacterium]|nr:dephospho-CoA kinase [Longimicrobiales bacterium]